MKLGAICCVYDHTRFLEIAFVPILEQLDSVLFLVNEIPWNGTSMDNAEAINSIEKLCAAFNKMEIVRGRWEDEAQQRNAGLRVLSERGIEYAAIIDDDEIYHPDHFLSIRQIIEAHGNFDAFHVELNTYWKDFYRIDPRENLVPAVAVRSNGFKFLRARTGITSNQFDDNKAPYNGIRIHPAAAICYHLSYVRDDAAMQRKLQSFSHSTEIQPGWYANVWMKWRPEMEDLHPVDPPHYKRAVKEDFSRFPPQLRTFIKHQNLDTRRCSIVVVNYNSCDLLKACLAAVTENTDREHEIIIVDNGSTKDDSVQYIESLPWKKVLSKANLGFAGGVNEGLKLTGDSDVCLLNVDAQVQKGWLTAMYETLKNYPECGLVGPLGNDCEGGHQREHAVEKDTTVYGLSGFCMLIMREVIEKIGFFDTRFGLGEYEDADYCARAKIAGYSSVLSARSLVRHKAHQVYERHGIDRIALDEKNRILFLEKFFDSMLGYSEAFDFFADQPRAIRSGLVVERPEPPVIRP